MEEHGIIKKLCDLSFNYDELKFLSDTTILEKMQYQETIVDKERALVIYSIRSEINRERSNSVLGYEKLLVNLEAADEKEIVIYALSTEGPLSKNVLIFTNKGISHLYGYLFSKMG